MKVLFTNFHLGWAGGHTTYIRELAKAFADSLDIHVASPRMSDVYEECAHSIPGIRMIALDFPSKPRELAGILRSGVKLRRLIQRERFDIIHVNGSPDHRLVMYAMVGLRGPKPKIVYTRHNSLAVSKGLSSQLRARMATDHVIAVSHHTAREMADTPYRNCGITTVHNGVDIAHFAPYSAEAARDARRELLGDACLGKLVVGTVTGFPEYKGTMQMVEAVAALSPEERSAVHILVAGELPDASMRARIRELGLEDTVTAIGLVRDVRSVIAAMDVGFVLSHAVETISFACREMMAMGKPVIVTNYAGLPENIAPHVDGWIVQPQSSPQIAHCLSEILQKRDALAAMGAAARRHSELAFGLDRFIAGTEAVYRHVLGTRPCR